MKAIAAFILGMGFLSACTNNEIAEKEDTGKAGSTFMSVAINLASNGGTRADNQQDTGSGDEPDYNFVGKWAGKDKISEIDVYVFNAASQLEAYQTFTTGQFSVQGAASDNTVTVLPSKGIKVLPGVKTVYVVVNPTAETKAYLPSTVGTNLTDFAAKYENTAEAASGFFKLANSGNATASVSTSADKLAKVDTDNTDVITMTVVEPATNVDVADNVSEAATLAGNTTNRAKLTVKRSVARVIVTIKANEFNVVGDDALTSVVEDDFVVGKIKNVKYVLGQGEQAMYLMQHSGGTANLTYKTPYSDYVATTSNYTWENAGNQYDYSGLWKGYETNGISGIAVPTKELYVANNNPQSLSNITAELMAQLNGEFILPNTHVWGATQDESGYRKGNTPYVLVRAMFVPAKVVMEDGTINENYPEGTTFFLGANGVFYENVTAARDTEHYGVAEQKASQYINGKTIYYAWVNPDNVLDGKWINSPVNRNNIYHIQIDGFKRIGSNWNPLVPNDPQHPDDPTNNPNNPDPKPGDVDDNEPNDPPVDPEDPLTPKETWMSVQTTILPWNVHSYSVVLDM